MSTVTENLRLYREKKEEEKADAFQKTILSIISSPESDGVTMYDAACKLVCNDTFQKVLFQESPGDLTVAVLKAKKVKKAKKDNGIPAHVKSTAKRLGSFLEVASALYVSGNPQKRATAFLKKVPGAAIPFVRTVNQHIESVRLSDYTLFQYVSETYGFDDEKAKRLISSVDPKKPYVPHYSAKHSNVTLHIPQESVKFDSHCEREAISDGAAAFGL